MSGEFVMGVVGEYEGPCDAGERLNAYIDALRCADKMTEGGVLALDDFDVDMGRLLAERIIDPVAPADFTQTLEELNYDCGMTGVDSASREPMPSEVSRQHPIRYDFFRIKAIGLARGAFGNQFADQVQEVYAAAIRNSS